MRSLTDIALSIFRQKDQRRQLAEELTRHRWQDQKSDYTNARAPRTDKHGGYITLDGCVAAQTLQCCHCPAHWVVRPGSGTVRGFCQKCMRATCGDPACDASGPNGCMPWLQKLERMEEFEIQRIQRLNG
jgi:hypothetical protein